MSFNVVIPARFASVRLPGKPLLEIAGRPMLQWVIQSARRSRAAEVIVATDDARVLDVAFDPAVPADRLGMMTSASHASGTDRIAEVARVRGWGGDVIVVNVQGDEPQLPSSLIDQVAGLLETRADAQMATLCTPILDIAELLDPNVVKVVRSDTGNALYFSRAPIPWHRDHAPAGWSSQLCHRGAQRHLGIYAYRVNALQRLTALPPSTLESAEKLEQLRALQAGMRIIVATAITVPGTGVDTEHDLATVRRSMQSDTPV